MLGVDGPTSLAPHMRRLLLLTTIALALLATPALAAPTQDVDVPVALADQIAAVKARTDVPVRLPAEMTVEEGDLFPSGTGDRKGWALGLDAAPDCGGANACFVASFSAQRGARPFGIQRVRLRGGRIGRFTPLGCGASCSPPQIQWKQGTTVYTIQARVGTRATERRMLVRMANSAILHGPR
jgi:uncharacterized protein (DUF58 family)